MRIHARAGLTPVEVIVALLVLVTGVLGLVGTSRYVLHRPPLSASTTDRPLALQAVVERIGAQDYDAVADGRWTDGIFSAEWTVEEANVSKTITIVTTGPGMVVGEGPARAARAVSDTSIYRVLMP
jgi:Tfp pilus assembly protein PilV